MFKMWFLGSSKCFKTTWISPKQPVELTQKLAAETIPPPMLIIFLCCHYIWSILYCNYSRSLILWISTFWKYLTHFILLVSFYAPWKHEKTRGLMMFSEGIKRDQCYEMAWNLLSKHNFLFIHLACFLKIIVM